MKYLPNTIKFLIYTYKFFKEKSILDKVFKQEQFVEKLTLLTQIKFKKDWIGRIYGVFNPTINIPKNEQILYQDEITQQYYLDNYAVHKFMMQRMDILEKFIHTNNLFEVLFLDIKDLTSEGYNGNYLIVIQSGSIFDIQKLNKWMMVLEILLAIGITFFLKSIIFY